MNGLEDVFIAIAKHYLDLLVEGNHAIRLDRHD